MMHTINLIWIVPTLVLLGYILGVFMCGATTSRKEEDAYRHGIEVGMNKQKLKSPYCQTLKELFDRDFDSDFDKFKSVTGGIIYGTEECGQIFIIFINDKDTLCQYYDKELLCVNDEAQYQRPVIKTEMV